MVTINNSAVEFL